MSRRAPLWRAALTRLLSLAAAFLPLAFGTARAEPAAAGPAAAVVEATIAEARRLELAAAPGWTTLYFMRPRQFGLPRPVIDSPAFYFAPRNGDWTPAVELEAGIKALLAPPVAGRKPDDHPACVFPERTHWLGARLPAIKAASKDVDCPMFRRWYEGLGKEKVSLVFSSYHADNPASMFGHSFLRFAKGESAGRAHSDLLDDTINFMAYPTTDNPLAYAISGSVGLFPGRFSMAPFYIKIQEYSHTDLRDLWEYELALDGAEIARLSRHLWELGPAVIDYFYFDENCALILLMVIDAARPSLALRPPHLWVIPSDTLRVVMESPGLVRQVHYRPSTRSRFLARYRALAASERDLVDDIVDANDSVMARAALEPLSETQRAAVIDTVVEYIDFDENLAGTKKAEKRGPLREALLLDRSRAKLPKKALEPPPPLDERPDRRGTSRTGLALGRVRDLNGGVSQDDINYVDASWRPALTDIAAPTLGYAGGLAITFWDTVVRLDDATRQAYLQRFDPMTIRSVPSVEAIVGPFAWALGLTLENRGNCASFWLGCYEKGVGGGAGPVAMLGPVTAYALLRVDAGSSPVRRFAVYAAPGVDGALLWAPSASTKITLGAAASRRFGTAGATSDRQELAFTAARLVAARFELRLSATLQRLDAVQQAGIEGGIYAYY